MPRSKQVLMALWLLVALSAIIVYLFFPQWVSAEAVKAFLVQSKGPVLLVFLLASLVRGVFFIPSTPFVVAGAMLFPEGQWYVFLISMAGVLAGATYIYFFTEYLEVEKVFSKHFEQKFARVKAGMARYGIWIVIAWAFFPVVPTDLISYTAGVTRMPYWKFILGISLGEVPLVAIYVFSGQMLGTWLLG